MPFVKGASGNPSGRPKKDRALTHILEVAGSATIEHGGKSLSGKRLVASLLWDIAKTGTCTLPSGKVYNVDGAAWFDVVKFLYAQIDGSPKQISEITGADGGDLVIQFVTKSEDRTLPEAE